MFDIDASGSLEDRYKWRSWNILLNSLVFANRAGIEELSGLWAGAAKPFDSLSGKAGSSKLMDIDNASTRFGALELWKFACASWSIAKAGSKLQQLAKPLVLELLERFNSNVKLFLQSTATSSVHLDARMMARFVKCLFKDYPEVLVYVLDISSLYFTNKAYRLAAEVQDQGTREMLKNIFLIASASDAGGFASSLSEPQNLPDAFMISFSDVWMSALQADSILNNSTATGKFDELLRRS